jgi:hypothetical protein
MTDDGPSPRTGRWALARYAAGWILAAAVLALLGIAVVDGGGDPPRRSELDIAVLSAGCVLREDIGRLPETDLDVGQPPTFGPSDRPAAPAVYRAAPPPRRLAAALRRGIVVLQYRRAVARTAVSELELILREDPQRSIVTPDGTGMRYAVAATAWRRLLGCPRATPAALTATRLFVARYRGQGPDASP